MYLDISPVHLYSGSLSFLFSSPLLCSTPSFHIEANVLTRSSLSFWGRTKEGHHSATNRGRFSLRRGTIFFQQQKGRQKRDHQGHNIQRETKKSDVILISSKEGKNTYLKMMSNTSQTPRLHGGNITLETVMRETDTNARRTKIVCTMGPACWSEQGIGTLMDAGMNVARFNFSHGDHESHGKVLDTLRKMAQQKSRNVGESWKYSSQYRSLFPSIG
jgi:hypothetical protein